MNLARDYFSRLFELVHGAEIRDRDGRLSIDCAARRFVEMIVRIRETGGKVLLVGNGGSAAIVSHLNNDLSKMCGVRALCFHEIPLLTAHSNDSGYHEAFARGVEQWGDPRDVLIAVSSSGRSPNIVAAAQRARARSMTVITFSGFDAANPLRDIGNLNVYVAADSYGPVELAHQMVIHWLSDCCADALHRTSKVDNLGSESLYAIGS